MRHSTYFYLISLIFLSAVHSSPFERVKNAPVARSVVAGGLLVVAAAIDIAQKSDRTACDKRNTALDTRSFGEKLADRSAAICTPKNWAALAREVVRVVWSPKNKKNTFLKRAAFFGKNHRLVSLMLVVNALNASTSAYQLCCVKPTPVPKNNGNQPSVQAPAETVEGSAVDENPESAVLVSSELKPISLKSTLNVRRKVRLSASLKRAIENRQSKKAALRRRLPSSPLRADDVVFVAPACVPDLSKRSLDVKFKTPVKARPSEEIPSPKTEFVTPCTLGARRSRDGGYEVSPGTLVAVLNALPQGAKKRLAGSLAVCGRHAGRSKAKGLTSGFVLNPAFAQRLRKEFDMPWWLNGQLSLPCVRDRFVRQADLAVCEDSNPTDAILPLPNVPQPHTPPRNLFGELPVGNNGAVGLSKPSEKSVFGRRSAGARGLTSYTL